MDTAAPHGRVQKFMLILRRHGWMLTLHDLLLRLTNRVVLFKVLKGIAVQRADPGFLEYPSRYRAGFLDAEALRAFSRNPEYEMSEGFVIDALAKGDECFAICDGAVLAAYGWYASTPTRIDPPDLRVHFGSGHIYMYKGFTHANYRGQRLHAITMTMALRHYLSKGYRGLVAYVESNNFDSLKSAYRMGYFQFGSVYVLKLLGRWWTRTSPGCVRFGLGVEPADVRVVGSEVRQTS